MAGSTATKRKGAALPATRPSGAVKGKGRALPLAAAPPRKRAKLTANAVQKPSNRPGQDRESSSDRDDKDGEQDNEEDDDASSAQAAMLAALEAHQASLLGDAIPRASTSSAAAPRERAGAVQPKSVWEMDDDDFMQEDDDEEEEEDESDSGGEEGSPAESKAAAAQVVAFVEPGRAGSTTVTPGPESAAPAMSKREMRDFKAGKVRNLHVKPSIADASNVKYVGGKAARRKAAAAAGDAKGVAALEKQAEEDVEESQLSKLDSHLSSLIKPLTSGSGAASLPDLLRELPIAASKPRKGHTPLPKNAPRTLRRGQNAANLKRAQARDDAAGFGQGAKKGAVGMGREALSLKEKRKAEGGEKRQRGIGGAAGKWGRGQLSLSKKEVRSINGPE